MSYMQQSEGGFQVVYPPRLVVPVLRSCQSPIWMWLVNFLYFIYICASSAGFKCNCRCK